MTQLEGAPETEKSGRQDLKGWDESQGAASPMLGFPCSLFSRGSFLSRSLSSSTRSIFSITCGA